MQETPFRPERVFRYMPGPADRLAFAGLSHELTGWEKLRLLVIVGISGMSAGMLPDGMGLVAWWTSVAAILVVGSAGRSCGRTWRSAARRQGSAPPTERSNSMNGATILRSV
jgi:hypothetical protein